MIEAKNLIERMAKWIAKHEIRVGIAYGAIEGADLAREAFAWLENSNNEPSLIMAGYSDTGPRWTVDQIVDRVLDKAGIDSDVAASGAQIYLNVADIERAVEIAYREAAREHRLRPVENERAENPEA